MKLNLFIIGIFIALSMLSFAKERVVTGAGLSVKQLDISKFNNYLERNGYSKVDNIILGFNSTRREIQPESKIYTGIDTDLFWTTKKGNGDRKANTSLYGSNSVFKIGYAVVDNEVISFRPNIGVGYGILYFNAVPDENMDIENAIKTNNSGLSLYQHNILLEIGGETILKAGKLYLTLDAGYSKGFPIFGINTGIPIINPKNVTNEELFSNSGFYIKAGISL